MSNDWYFWSTGTTMAEVRKAAAPAPTDPDAVEQTCSKCGTTFYRRKRRPKYYCPDCAAVRADEAADQLKHKSGPVYERAALRQHAYWTAELERLGLKPGG